MAIAKAVSQTRDDLEGYRSAHPEWAAGDSERGRANWIHDRLWSHFTSELDRLGGAPVNTGNASVLTLLAEHPGDRPEFLIVDKGSTREVYVRDRFRIRVKRHYRSGQVSVYPTQTALDFLAQPRAAGVGKCVREVVQAPLDLVEPPQAPLPGTEMVHLIAGYLWDKDANQIGPPVLSLRDGADNIVWLVELSEDGGRSNVIGMPRSDGPASPGLVVRSAPQARTTGEEWP